jgi:hypothetical protein
MLTMEVRSVNGAFTGAVSKALDTIDGTWTQGVPLPLSLKRVSNAASELKHRVRPQDPVKPYPYNEEQVTFENKAQKVTLAATLTVPQGNGPFPAVLLIAGSGPHDRDEKVFGHRPFLVLADYLTRKGIIVLRADKRGMGKSTGDLSTATTADFATDAEAGIAYLKTRPEVNVHEIGLLGHSEGGLVAPMVAARNADVGFVVMMAGSGVAGDKILPEQVRLIEIAYGKPKDQVEKDYALQQEIVAIVEQEKDDKVFEQKLRAKLSGSVPEAQIGASVTTMRSPWMRYFLQYDPATALRKVTCPLLALNGEKDLQVPPHQNLPAIRAALVAAGNKRFEIDELPGLNHLFQTAKTGAPAEYSQIDETIAPIALGKIAGWILKQ